MRWLIFSLLFLCSFYVVAGHPELVVSEETYRAGETIMGTIIEADTLLEKLEREDLVFFEGRRKIPLGRDIVKYNGTYYFYAYTNEAGNISLEIGPLLYKEDGVTKERTLRHEFVIAEAEVVIENASEKEVVSIRPGFIDFAEKNSLRLFNTGTVGLAVNYLGEEIFLNATTDQEIVLEPVTELAYLEIETYKTFLVPLIPNTKTPTKERLHKLDVIHTSEESFDVTLQSGGSGDVSFTLTNTGDQDAHNTSIGSDIEFVHASPEFIEKLSPNESTTITLTIEGEGRGRLEGKTEIIYDYNSEKGLLQIPLTLLLVPTGFNARNITSSPLTCADEGGRVCTDTEFCSGEATYSKDGKYCCLTTCIEIDISDNDSSATGWIAGIIIFILLGGVGYWAYKKQKKLKTKNPLENATLPYRQGTAGKVNSAEKEVVKEKSNMKNGVNTDMKSRSNINSKTLHK